MEAFDSFQLKKPKWIKTLKTISTDQGWPPEEENPFFGLKCDLDKKDLDCLKKNPVYLNFFIQVSRQKDENINIKPSKCNQVLLSKSGQNYLCFNPCSRRVECFSKPSSVWIFLWSLSNHDWKKSNEIHQIHQERISFSVFLPERIVVYYPQNSFILFMSMQYNYARAKFAAILFSLRRISQFCGSVYKHIDRITSR